MAVALLSRAAFPESHPQWDRIYLALDSVCHASSVVQKMAGNVQHYMLKPEKGDPTDPVTAIDRQIEDYVVAQIRSKYPDDAILAEEAHHDDSQIYRSDCYLWILDPIDGTKNFIHGSHHCSISLAVALGDLVELGVVEAPLFGETFWAVRGVGAFSSVRGRLHVSQIQELPHAALTYDINSRDEETLNLWFERCRRLLSHPVQTLRCHGSAALEICGVARGATEGHLEAGLDLWDIAASWLIINEAGGCIRDMDGKPLSSLADFKGNILACNNDGIAAKVLESINARSRL